MNDPKQTGGTRISIFLSKYWGAIALILAWQLWVSLGELNAVVVPGPVAVAADIFFNPGLYVRNGAETFLVAVAGLIAGFVAGVLIAIAAWASRILNGLLTPLGLVFSSIPVVALIPIIARLLGYDISTVIAIVAISAFFPTFIFAGSGLQSLPAGSSDLFRVMGASRWQTFLRLVLPSAVPNIMIAIRLIAPEAVLAAILAELLMGTSGLGFLFREASSRFAMDRAFGTSIIATIISVTCFGLALAAERAVARRWK
ncbi:ABC transporter [Rhizobium sp. AC44/96]|uniref:ABC transporter permease n=1 Tax=unclassified Rhizobium TaxID=2613769 RepID=UPI00080F9E92|nr:MULTISPECIES: ABC transporter permease subunit [unclassified Rhizobium]MDM9623013.1 ABC transporter permease subunit [Rhizobium sp. S96]OCJ13101.1 ABC transporter [Rhizobium sp. AC44/96]